MYEGYLIIEAIETAMVV